MTKPRSLFSQRRFKEAVLGGMLGMCAAMLVVMAVRDFPIVQASLENPTFRRGTLIFVAAVGFYTTAVFIAHWATRDTD